MNGKKACELADLYLESFGGLETALDRDGRRLLHLACNYSNDALVRYLLERGANVNDCDFLGNSPLHLAAIHTGPDDEEGVECVRLLLERGADANVRNLHGQRPVDRVFNEEVRKLLVEPGS